MFKKLFATLMLLALAACASVQPSAYRDQKPALELARYFNGTLIGHGMLSGRSGEVDRRFVVTVKASWSGDTGTLNEDFVWSDGERQTRVWTLRKSSQDAEGVHYIGTAPDVIGEAQGLVAGNALNWKYTLAVKTKEGKTYDIAFDDWMYLIDDQSMLNRAVMSWYGFRVGEIFISFRKS